MDVFDVICSLFVDLFIFIFFLSFSLVFDIKPIFGQNSLESEEICWAFWSGEQWK